MITYVTSSRRILDYYAVPLHIYTYSKITVGNPARTESIQFSSGYISKKCQSAKCRVQKIHKKHIHADRFRRVSGNPTEGYRHSNTFNKKLITPAVYCYPRNCLSNYTVLHPFVLDCINKVYFAFLLYDE